MIDFTQISEGKTVVAKQILFSEQDVIRFLCASGGNVGSYKNEENMLEIPPILMAGKALGTMLGETGIPKEWNMVQAALGKASAEPGPSPRPVTVE